MHKPGRCKDPKQIKGNFLARNKLIYAPCLRPGGNLVPATCGDAICGKGPFWVSIQREDRQLKHAAAAIPTEALRKGTETVEKTVRKKFTTKCTRCSDKENCVGATFARDLYPAHKLGPDGKPCGIVESCFACYNYDHNTKYTQRGFS